MAKTTWVACTLLALTSLGMGQKLEVAGDERPAKGEITGSQAYKRLLTWFKALNRDATGKTIRLTYGQAIWSADNRTWRYVANAQGPLDREARSYEFTFECDETRTVFQDYSPRETLGVLPNPFPDERFSDSTRRFLEKTFPGVQFKVSVVQKSNSFVGVRAWEVHKETVVFSNRYAFLFSTASEKMYYADILRLAKGFDNNAKAKLTNTEAYAKIREALTKPAPTELVNPWWGMSEVENLWASWKSAGEKLSPESLRLFYWIPDDKPSVKKARLHYVWYVPGGDIFFCVDAVTGETWVQLWSSTLTFRKSAKL